MDNLWDRFDNIVTPKEVDDAKAQFDPFEAGEYECILEAIEAGESKDGLPMLKGKFRVIENNRILFYNQMLQNLNYPNMTAVNVAEAVKFIDGLTGEEVIFTSLGKLAERVTNMKTGGQYIIEVAYGKKDLEMKFPKLKVVEAIEVPF